MIFPGTKVGHLRSFFLRTIFAGRFVLHGSVILLVLLTLSSFAFAQEGKEKKPKQKRQPAAVDSVAQAIAEQRKALSPAALNQYRKTILPAITAGDDLAFLQAMEAMVSKQKPETIEQLEAYARANGLGSLKQRFTQLLVESIEQGLPIQPQAMKPAFVEWATNCLLEKIDADLNELDQHALMIDPLTLPKDLRDTEQLFWEVHVWKNRMLNMDELIKYVVAMQKPQLDRANKQEDQDSIEALQAPHEMAERVKHRHQEMIEREAELRIADLTRAEEVLRLNPDFERQLNAAFVLELQGGELTAFFKNHPPGSLMRKPLNEEDVIEKIEALVKAGREQGGHVIEKAVLLRVGAHWWLRGRYGMASMADGLLKPPAAMTSRYLMEGLFMPKKRPQPIGAIETESGQESPGYDRRHFYTWAIEIRNISMDNSNSSTRNTSRNKIGGSAATTFW